MIPAKQRLRRLDELFDREPVYFVTACTHDRKKLLTTKATHAAFVCFAKLGADRGVFVGRYVLMPDHFHLFVALRDEPTALSAWVKSLKNYLSKSWREQGIKAPHWQKGFFDHVLRSDESYAAKWGYTLENPVRAKLVACAEDWPYQGQIHPIERRRS